MRVVIIGGGFGGVRSALRLANRRDVEVKLIVSQTYFEYHAALYRSATGRSPLEVAIPLKDFFEYAKNVEVVEDPVDSLAATDHYVIGKSGARYPYDKLVIALGNVTEYYGIRGLKDYAYGVKTIQEALHLKRHLHEQLLHETGERNYVVIGAGATGSELSAELPAYLKKIRRKHKIKRQFSVELIEAAARPVAAMQENFSKLVSKRLRHVGVKLMLNTKVMSETVEGLRLSHGSLATKTVIWTAGVTNHPFLAGYPQVFSLEKNRRVQVNEFLEAYPDIYVIGDSANTPYSGMAQTALYDANFVVNNLFRIQYGKKPQAYSPKKPIYAIPVGPHWAAVLWGKVQISGRMGWALRRLADLRLYLKFLPLRKALTTWRYGFVNEEVCPICKQ